MKPSRQIFALLLGVFVALGMSPAPVQAGGMVGKMAKMIVTSGMDASGYGDCGGCAGGDGGGAKAMACGTICIAPVFAVPPQALTMPVVPARVISWRQDPHPHGRASPPDPYPPRSGDLG